MKGFLLLLAFAGFAWSVDITFDNRPERGIPAEARSQQKTDAKSHGTVAKLLGDSLQSVAIRYYDETWPDKPLLTDYIAGIFTDERSDTWTFQIWSQGVGVPEVECVLNFKNHTQGRLLIWGTVACLRDGEGKWWYVSLFDHYHRKHPKGDRKLSRPPAKQP